MRVVVDCDVAVPMRDGTVLRANVHRPDDGAAHAAIIERTPYGKDAARPSATIDPMRAARSGFAVVVQDVRGQGSSEGGAFFMFRDEFDDGYDTVEWAASQPWCTGRVGLYGTSYGGNTSWQAAIAAPPSLGAIAPVQSPIDYVEGWEWLARDGVLKWGLLANWTLTAIAESQIRRHRDGADLPARLEALAALMDDPAELFATTPLTRVGARLQDVVGGAADGGEAPLSFFRAVTEREVTHRWRADTVVARSHSQVRVPALITASWYDVILGHDLEHFARVRREAATEVARERTRLLVGPWSHGMFLNVVGAVDFGRRATGGSLDFGADLGSIQAEWFASQLGGTGARRADGPRVRLFVQGVNRWRDEDDWPLASARPTAWFLRADGRLAPEPPGAREVSDQYVFDPNDPCPTCGGDLVKPPDHAPGPQDQAPVIARPDVLVYTSEALDRDLEVIGPVTAVLHAGTTGVSTDFVVKLCDVHPDGRTFNVCDGVVRTTSAVGVWPVDLWATAIVFRAGHRISVLVSSSDFPRYERNPNTGEPPWEATVFEPVRQTVFHDSTRASHVVLPVIP